MGKKKHLQEKKNKNSLCVNLWNVWNEMKFKKMFPWNIVFFLHLISQIIHIRHRGRGKRKLTSPATWGCSCSCCAEKWRSEPSPRTLWTYWAGSAAGSPAPYLRGETQPSGLKSAHVNKNRRWFVSILTYVGAEEPLVELGGVAARWWTRLWRKHRRLQHQRDLEFTQQPTIISFAASFNLITLASFSPMTKT